MNILIYCSVAMQQPTLEVTRGESLLLPIQNNEMWENEMYDLFSGCILFNVHDK